MAHVSCSHDPYIVYRLSDTHGEHEKIKIILCILTWTSHSGILRVTTRVQSKE